MNSHQATSTGHNLGACDHLDQHYAALQAEYEATLLSAGLQPGWRILDAGSGNGAFLPQMAKQLGPSGHITAVDLAPENVERVKSLVAGEAFGCPADAQVGDVTALPFARATFDATWSANVSQYLTADQLAAAMDEFRRVTRPGGLIAVKEVDISVWQFQPQDPRMMWRLLEALQADTQMVGAMRGTRLPLWFRRCGLEDVVSHTTLAERRQPLRPVERAYLRSNLVFLSGQAASVDLPEEDRQAWARIAEEPDALLSHPDFCYRELWVLTTGLVPRV